MKEVKKIKKKRFNFLKFLIFLLVLYIIFYGIKYLISVPIKNIIIKNNNYLSDELIIETAGIDNYPSFIKTSKKSICKKLSKLDLIESCSVSKKQGFILEINIQEKVILYEVRSSGNYVLSDGTFITKSNIYNGIPVLINYIPEDIEETLIKSFSKINSDVLFKISEIEYSPTSYDNERFILYMTDENMIYITLTKIKSLNKYDEIKGKLEGHKGVLYLDSGNYFEIKE